MSKIIISNLLNLILDQSQNWFLTKVCTKSGYLSWIVSQISGNTLVNKVSLIQINNTSLHIEHLKEIRTFLS